MLTFKLRQFLNNFLFLLILSVGSILGVHSSTSNELDAHLDFFQRCCYHSDQLLDSASNATYLNEAKDSPIDEESFCLEDFVVEFNEKEKEKEKEEDRKWDEKNDVLHFYLFQDHHSFQYISDGFCKLSSYQTEHFPIVVSRKYLFYDTFLI